MKDNWKVLFQEIIALIQKYQDKHDNDEKNMKQYEISINEKYKAIADQGEIRDFYAFLLKEFGMEPELYTLLLSVMFNFIRDEFCILNIYQYLSSGQVELFNSLGIRLQLDFKIFTSPDITVDYGIRRKLHKVQIDQMEKALHTAYPYVPIRERNQNRILVMTNQLLSNLHAPTRNTIELCQALYEMGKEVYLVVVVENINSEKLNQCWLQPSFVNYYEELTGSFAIEDKETIYGEQIIINENNLPAMKKLIDDIYQFNPLFVLYAGGTSVYADLFRNFTTVASMPYTAGYSISEAQIMVEYVKGGTKEYDRMTEYIKNGHQTPIHFEYYQKIRPSDGSFSRMDFALPEDGFIIAVAGNRLDEEIKDDFITILYKIMDLSPRIHIAFLGNKTVLPSDEYRSRISYLGFQKDLLGVLGLMDLFLNPPRKGGGTSALWSLYNSVPVITLDHCDVASYINESFLCADVAEMPALVNKYLIDSEFYKMQSIRAKQLATEYETKNNLPESIDNLINHIKSTVVEMEVSRV